ncbi:MULTISPECIES: response regulator [Clostridium]|uniref:response regulator n=1 Tax=Clostridium TaxID=1485 RepID=UPI000824BA0B|nr:MULTISPECIES: response regulator [Clostridium]PJI10062.1 response regulator [Clostridium sp. CT7]
MKKVLIVDNSSYMRMFIRKIIEKNGSYKVSEAEGKDDSIERVNIEKPDIVILDLNMSEATLDGIEVLKDIMKINPETNVIIMSAVGHQDVKDECMALGAKSYIRKPVDTKALLKAMN